MKSPFPGMDPYLERHWGDVHHRLIQYACDVVQPSLPNDLRARVEERVFVTSESGQTRRVIPDVSIARVYPPPPVDPTMLREAGAACAEPLVFEVTEPPITEGFIEIREPGGGKVVTVIEFLSPANKLGGAGQAKYIEKQTEVLGSDANLVEIDLVRAGHRVLALPVDRIPEPARCHYLACISPGWSRNRRELFVMPLRERLPVLPIPLRTGEKPVPLDLQALVDQAYAAGRYDDLNYALALEPPLAADDAAWANGLVSAARAG